EVALRARRLEAVRRAAGHDEVIAVLVRHVAEDRLEDAAALVDEDDLVALAVPEEVLHRLLRAAQRDLDVVVPHQDAPAADLVAGLVDLERVEMAVRVLVGNPFVALDLLEAVELHDAARRLQVVEDRLVPGESLEPHHLLGEKRPVLAKLDVPLARDVAETLVEG